MNKCIEIDLSAIRHNLGLIKKSLNREVKLMAVVKADAYGHGAVEISRVALREGAAMLGVLGLDEALELRKAGIKAPIAMLGAALPGEAGEIVRNSIIPTVDSLAFLSALNKAVSSLSSYNEFRSALNSKLSALHYSYYLDLNYGLARWGIEPSGLKSFLKKSEKFKKTGLAGVSTHLDYVPGKNAVEVEEKLPLFQRSAETVRQYYPGAIRHAANSSILRDFPHWQLDMVRIGNLMYGIHPSATHGVKPKDELTGFKNPWKFLARITSVRPVKAGESVGYASEYIAPRNMKVACVPAGYADGVTLSPAERFIRLRGAFRFWGMMKGHKPPTQSFRDGGPPEAGHLHQTPFVGRCGIAHTLLDVTDVPGVKVGDVVHLPIRRTAASFRIPRIYKG
ncbi:MAG: alanine racemase [bacterium]